MRNALEVELPSPCIVASTEGWGEELFSKRMEAGSAKVLAATCRNSTTLIPSQIGIPPAGSGAAVELGRRAKNGVRKYAKGNRARDHRKERIRPRRRETVG